MSQFTNFEVAVSRIFESSPAELSNRTRKEQAEWWDDYYRPRPGEMEKFNVFLLNQESPLCRITGGVGAGKTTFVLEKIFRSKERRVCNGFWIDLSSFSDKLRKVEADTLVEFARVERQTSPPLGESDLDKIVSSAISDALSNEIANRVIKRFYLHFMLLRTERIAEEYRRHDCVYVLDVDFPPFREGEILKHEAEAWLDVAATLFVLNPTARKATQRARILKGTKFGGLGQEQRDLLAVIALVRENLVRDESLAEDLIDYVEEAGSASDILAVQTLLSAYSRYFRYEEPLLILDNLDQTPNSDLHKTIFDYVDRLALSLKSMDVGGVPVSRSELSGGSAPIRSRQFKIVYTLRDENIRSSNKKTAIRSYTEHKIALAQPGEGYLGDGLPEYLEMDDDALLEIISKRIQVARRSLPEWADQLEQFEEVVSAIWSPLEGNHPTAFRGRILLGKITNFSIQVALSMAYQLSLQLVRDITNDGRDLTEYLKTSYQIAFRGRIVNWLLGYDETGRPLANFARREVDLIKNSEERSHLCCAHRLILTYLNNRFGERGGGLNPQVFVGEVTEHLNRISGLPASHIKQVIFQLYQPQDSQREYITLCEGPPVDSADSISDDHDISLNPRGRTFLLRIMPRLEYWRYLSTVRTEGLGSFSLGSQTGRTIFECTPKEAVGYIQPIVQTVSDLAKVHEANWKSLVDRYARLANKERPFTSFWVKNGMTVGEAFYLERVAASHQTEIQTYISEVFRGEDSSILLKDGSKKQFYDEWPRLKSHVLGTGDAALMLETYLENYDTRPENRLAAEKLALFLTRYQEIYERFNALKRKTKGQLSESSE